MSNNITPIGKKNPNLPFHPAVRAGDFIYVSGQVAKDEKGNMCVGNIEEETRWTLEGIKRILALEGADLSDVVKIETQKIDLAIENNDLHSKNATLVAGQLAKIETRAMTEGDQICHNESVWYQPLSRTSHAMPAYALSNQYAGKDLGVTWSSPDKRSAFVASFSEPSE